MPKRVAEDRKYRSRKFRFYNKISRGKVKYAEKSDIGRKSAKWALMIKKANSKNK